MKKIINKILDEIMLHPIALIFGLLSLLCFVFLDKNNSLGGIVSLVLLSLSFGVIMGQEMGK